MIVAYEPEHLVALRPQEWQKGAAQSIDFAQTLLHGHCAYTALCNTTGRPLICAGLAELWTNRAFCWALFDYASKPVLLEAHRRCRLELDRAPFKRVEMYVKPGFQEAFRWAAMLGFKLECLMECGSPNSEDVLVFKRIKRGPATRRLM